MYDYRWVIDLLIRHWIWLNVRLYFFFVKISFNIKQFSKQKQIQAKTLYFIRKKNLCTIHQYIPLEIIRINSKINLFKDKLWWLIECIHNTRLKQLFTPLLCLQLLLSHTTRWPWPVTPPIFPPPVKQNIKIHRPPFTSSSSSLPSAELHATDRFHSVGDLAASLRRSHLRRCWLFPLHHCSAAAAAASSLPTPPRRHLMVSCRNELAYYTKRFGRAKPCMCA